MKGESAGRPNEGRPAFGWDGGGGSRTHDRAI